MSGVDFDDALCQIYCAEKRSEKWRLNYLFLLNARRHYAKSKKSLEQKIILVRNFEISDEVLFFAKFQYIKLNFGIYYKAQCMFSNNFKILGRKELNFH